MNLNNNLTKSQIDFFLPKFKENFIRSPYLKNINDYNIEEGQTLNYNRVIKNSLKINKTNSSIMDSYSKAPENCHVISNSWPIFQEK